MLTFANIGQGLNLPKLDIDDRKGKGLKLQIAAHLKIHEKSDNRYVNLMVELGFKVEDSHGKYHHYRIKNGWEYFI